MGDQGQPSAPPTGQGATAVDYKTVGAGQAAADFNGAVGHGWKFNDAEMGSFLKILDDEVEHLKHMSVKAEPLNQIIPCGDEIASHQAAIAQNASGVLAQAQIQGGLEFLTAYTDHIRQVRDAYLKSDQAALDALRTAGKDA